MAVVQAGKWTPNLPWLRPWQWQNALQRVTLITRKIVKCTCTSTGKVVHGRYKRVNDSSALRFSFYVNIRRDGNWASAPVPLFVYVQEKMLRNLSDADKKDVGELLTAIEKTFSLYWRHYPPYNRLQDRSSTLDTLLHDESPESRSGRSFVYFDWKPLFARNPSGSK